MRFHNPHYPNTKCLFCLQIHNFLNSPPSMASTITIAKTLPALTHLQYLKYLGAIHKHGVICPKYVVAPHLVSCSPYDIFALPNSFKTPIKLPTSQLYFTSNTPYSYHVKYLNTQTSGLSKITLYPLG